MNRTCTRMHDGKYPQEAVLAFCTKVDCDKRFACGLCYHDYHKDHFPQLVQIKELPLFIRKVNGQPQETQNMINKLEFAKKELVQTIKSLFNNLQKIALNHEDNITEEILDQIVKQKDCNSQSMLIKIKETISDFQKIENVLKQDIRIQSLILVVKDRFFNDVRYSGEVLIDMMHGTGTGIYKDGSYHGQYFKGQRCGKGIFKWSTGDQYDGEWKDDKQTGRGVKTFSCGTTYHGEWKDNKRNGRGIQKWASGDIYDGEWKDDHRNGRGVYKWPNGDIYDGEWKDNKRNGRGIQKWASGDIYDGEWKDDQCNGRGVYKWPNGDIYDGEWKDHKQTGRGVKTFSCGTTYDGEWKDNKKNGRGIQKWGIGSQYNGDVYEGDWFEDKRTSGKYIYISGNMTIGKFNDSLRVGDHEFYELKKTLIITYKDDNEIKRKQI